MAFYTIELLDTAGDSLTFDRDVAPLKAAKARAKSLLSEDLEARRALVRNDNGEIVEDYRKPVE